MDLKVKAFDIYGTQYGGVVPSQVSSALPDLRR